ncbi:MAG: hypothetical protein PVI40_08640 [Chlamydiota bacterium]
MLGCIFITLPLMGNEKLPLRIAPKNQGIKINIQNIKSDFMGDWNALPYVQMEFIAPGVGVCIRSPDLPLKLEVNFKASYIVFWYSVASSVSVLYGKKAANGMLYLGLGGGFFAVNAFHGSYGMMGIKFSPLANMFLGYESKGGFFDVGMDVVRSTYVHFPVEDSYLSVVPTIRYGWKF